MSSEATESETRVPSGSGPSAGERARTMAYGVADGVLAVPGVPYAAVPAHVTDENGRPLLLVPTDSAAVKSLRGAREDAVPATLRIADVAPVPLADRVRGRAWVRGWAFELAEARLKAAAIRISRLHPRPELLDVGTDRGDGQDWTILALEIAEVEVKDAWGGATLDAEEYAAATPDPFVAVEGGMLGHLDSCHRPELVTMLRRLNGAPGVPAVRDGNGPVVRPLGLDRYGMWLRCSGPEPDAAETVDVRLVFGEPVSDIHGLRCMYRRLFAGTHS